MIAGNHHQRTTQVENTVKICGIDNSNCELVARGAHTGIRTPTKIYWLFPECDDEGKEIKTLPPYLPCEIRAVTVAPPDLTQQFPETVKKLFDQRHSYFSKTATLTQYLGDNPDLRDVPTAEEFEQQRERILSEPVDIFLRSPRLRSMVWDLHGNQKLANQVGYLGMVWETETLKDGTVKRFSQSASVAGSLAHALASARKIGENTAWEIIGTLRYVMIYEGVPGQQFIYLKGMKSTTHLPSDVPSAPDGPNGRLAQIESPAAVALVWPTLERVEILTRQQQQAATVEAKNLKERKKLLDKELKLEIIKEENRKEASRVARQHTAKTVTRAEVCQQLNVGERQVRKICQRHGVGWPQTQGQLDGLQKKHDRRKRAVSEALVKRTRQRDKSQRGDPN